MRVLQISVFALPEPAPHPDSRYMGRFQIRCGCRGDKIGDVREETKTTAGMRFKRAAAARARLPRALDTEPVRGAKRNGGPRP